MKIKDLGKVAVVNVKDKLNWFNCSELKSQVILLMAQNRKDIVINLAKAKYIDSSGIHALFFLSDLLKRHARTLKLTGLQSSTMPGISTSFPSISLKTGLYEVCEVFEDLEEAVASGEQVAAR